MRARVGLQSYVIGVLGVVMVLAPGVLLGFASTQPYEAEITRWAGVCTLGLAVVRPWAIRDGGRTASRMRSWTALAVVSGIAYVVNTNPLFLVVGMAAIAGGVLDGSVEWATRASEDLRQKLIRDRRR